MLAKLFEHMPLWKRSLFTMVGMLGVSSIFLATILAVVASVIPKPGTDDQRDEQAEIERIPGRKVPLNTAAARRSRTIKSPTTGRRGGAS